MAQPSAVRRTGLTTRAFAFPDISAVPNPVSALTTTGDTRRLAEVGDWIIDCATGDDLIARFGNSAGSGR